VSAQQQAGKEFSFIIVGAGSAGCVLAKRLCDSGARVLLIEAGGRDTHRFVRIPAAFSKLYQSQFDWNLSTTPQPGLRWRSLYWPRGKMLGGSSSLNAMIYIRGNRQDYDGWQVPGWSFAEVLPSFLRSEDFFAGPSAHHGVGGELRVEPGYQSDITTALIEAARQAGMPHNPDFNGEHQEGVGAFHTTTRGGERWSVADGFLKPILGNPNLSVLTNTQVERVLFEKTSGETRAVGVQYRLNGIEFAVYAEKAIIISGGAVHSPQLLMLSGIGPAEHLREHGLEVVQDSPEVGSNLHDHLAVPVIFRAQHTTTLDGAERHLGHLAQYAWGKTGPLSSNIAEGGGFVRLGTGATAPDLQLHFAAAFFSNHGLDRQTGQFFTIGPTLLQPNSRGSLRLRSGSIMDDPIIDPNYGAEPQDLAVLAHGVELARDIAAQSALAKLQRGEVQPGSWHNTREMIVEYVRRAAQTIYHPTSTCRMGTDARSVVDEHLAVRGVRGLYVVDASVMPTVPRGNTNAPTIMVAEHASTWLVGL
jgi:choline dehydrogenase